MISEYLIKKATDNYLAGVTDTVARLLYPVYDSNTGTFYTSNKNIQPLSTIMGDHGADDLDVVELAMALEDKYGIDIPDEVMRNDLTVLELANQISKLVQLKGISKKAAKQYPNGGNHWSNPEFRDSYVPLHWKVHDLRAADDIIAFHRKAGVPDNEYKVSVVGPEEEAGTDYMDEPTDLELERAVDAYIGDHLDRIRAEQQEEEEIPLSQKIGIIGGGTLGGLAGALAYGIPAYNNKWPIGPAALTGSLGLVGGTMLGSWLASKFDK